MNCLTCSFHQDTGDFSASSEVILSRPAGKVRLAGSGKLIGNVTWQDIADTAEKLQPEDAAKLLNGPAAFVCVKDNSLFIACDRFGQKSIFITRNGNEIYLSESLRDLNPCANGTDYEALADFLCLGYFPAPKTLWKNITRIPAASIASLSTSGEISIRKYWTPEFQQNPLSIEDAADQAEVLFKSAVEKCLKHTDTSVSLLSGGIDSSLVAAFARPAHACTIGFGEKQYDESSIAKETAAALGIAHHTQSISPKASSLLPELLKLSGEPFADSSLISTACAMKLAANYGPCVLCGDGGDELFGGYRRYRFAAIRQFLGETISRTGGAAMSTLLSLLPHNSDQRSRLADLQRTASAFAKPFIPAYASFQQYFTPDELDSIAPGLKSHYLDTWQQSVLHLDNLTEQANFLDLSSYLPDDGCRKCAIASAAAGVTALSPMLDLPLAEFALALPHNLRFSRKDSKPVLKSLASRHLPESILAQPKLGFGIPLADWLRSDPLTTMLRDLTPSANSIFNPKEYSRLLNEHLARKANHASRLWALLCCRIFGL